MIHHSSVPKMKTDHYSVVYSSQITTQS